MKTIKSLSNDTNIWNDEVSKLYFNSGCATSEWTRQTESVFNNYKKELIRNYKDKTHHRYSKSILITDLASIFRLSRAPLKEGSFGSQGKSASLKGLQKYLKERNSYLSENGYMNTEMDKGLEEIYGATIKLVLSEKILEEFHTSTAEYYK